MVRRSRKRPRISLAQRGLFAPFLDAIGTTSFAPGSACSKASARIARNVRAAVRTVVRLRVGGLVAALAFPLVSVAGPILHGPVTARRRGLATCAQQQPWRRPQTRRSRAGRRMRSWALGMNAGEHGHATRAAAARRFSVVDSGRHASRSRGRSDPPRAEKTVASGGPADRQ